MLSYILVVSITTLGHKNLVVVDLESIHKFTLLPSTIKNP